MHTFTKIIKIVLITLCSVVCLILVAAFLFSAWHNWGIFQHQFLVQDKGSSELVYHPIVQNRDSTTSVVGTLPGIVESGGVMENGRHTMEGDNVILNKIIDTTSNTITYFSAIIAALALFAGFAMWKYYRKVLEAQQRIQELGNSVLQNALITLHAVPFVKATQITSSEHLLAIKHIARLAEREEANILTNPEYSPILLCKGLSEYFAGSYGSAIKAMTKAYDLAGISEPAFRKVIAFHLARTYKQRAYYELESKSNPNEERIMEYLTKAEDYKDNAPSWLMDSLQLSIEAIKYQYQKMYCGNKKDGKDKHCIFSFLRKKRGKGSGPDEGANQFESIVNAFVENHRTGRYHFSRMTAIPMWLEIHNSSEPDYNNNANDFITYLESRLQGQSGDNIFASWYFSIARVYAKLNKKEEAIKNLNLASSYYDAIREQKDIKTLFTYDFLTEIRKEEFEKRMMELERDLNNND